MDYRGAVEAEERVAASVGGSQSQKRLHGINFM